MVLFVVGAAFGVKAPIALEVGEPFIVSAAWYSGTGGSLYAPIDGMPFLHNNYHPLAQWMVAPILAMTGPSFVPMRVLTALAAAGIAVIVGVLVARNTGSRGAGAISAGMLFSVGFVFPWLCLGRVDALATFFSCLAMAVGAGRPRSWWWLIPAWLAFATKQTAIAGASALIVHAWCFGDRRRVVYQALTFGVGAVAIVGLFSLLTRGESFRHAIVYNAEHDRGTFWPTDLPPLALLWALGPTFVLALVALVAPRLRSLARSPYLIWFGLSFALALVFVRKSGSHVHYFLESVAALAVLAGIAGHATLASWARRSPGAAFGLAGLLALSVLPIAHQEHWQKLKHFRHLCERKDPIGREVREAVAGSQAPLLLLSKLGSLAVEAGKPAHLDIADFVRLTALGRFDAPKNLVPLIEAKAFGVIGWPSFENDETAAQHFDPARLAGFEAAVRTHYQPLGAPLDDPKGYHRGTFWVPKR